MRSVKSGVTAIKLGRKDDDVTMIGLCNEGKPFHRSEIIGFGQTNPYAVARVGTVRDEVGVFHEADARVLNTKFLIGGKRLLCRRRHERLRVNSKLIAIIAFRQTDDGAPVLQMRPEKHSVPAFMFDHARVVNCFYWVRHIRLSENRIPLVSLHNRLFGSSYHPHASFLIAALKLSSVGG